jgi:ABC-2 type transport system permease protein
MAIIMTLIGTLLTALVVSREWERGTMEAMMSTPVGIWELIIGKLIPYYLLALGTMTMIVILSIVIYDLPMRGSWFALYSIVGTFLVPALGLGLLISTLSRNQLISSQMAIVTGFMPAFMLSGFIFEIASMPAPIRMITYIWPARYFVSCLQTVFLAGDDWSLFAPNMAAMAFIGMILFGLTARHTVKRLD